MNVWNFFRSLRLRYYRSKIKSHEERTIVCNNCLGGMLYHDFGIRFCSPFINLMIPTPHFVEILSCIDRIHEFDMTNITPNNSCYPIGLLNSKWELHFMHYKTYDEAYAKWEERVQRMDFTKLYVILVETHSASYKDLVDFDKLPFKNKIILTHKVYPDIKNSVLIKQYDGINLNGELFWPANRFGASKYDQFDWLNFLNLK